MQGQRQRQQKGKGTRQIITGWLIQPVKREHNSKLSHARKHSFYEFMIRLKKNSKLRSVTNETKNIPSLTMKKEMLKKTFRSICLTPRKHRLGEIYTVSNDEKINAEKNIPLNMPYATNTRHIAILPIAHIQNPSTQ